MQNYDLFTGKVSMQQVLLRNSSAVAKLVQCTDLTQTIIQWRISASKSMIISQMGGGSKPKVGLRLYGVWCRSTIVQTR